MSSVLKQNRLQAVDESCRSPLMLMFVSAAGWLVISGFLAILASIRFHSGGILADVSWLTYGRVYGASINSLVYGFGIQGGLGVALWLICRMGQARLAGGLAVTMGAAFWNIGVTLGIVGILCGGSTGFEWFEMPGQTNLILLAAYVMIAGFGLVSFHHRRERDLYPAQWFLVAALFWFPWIFTTASALLVGDPARGAMQAVVAWWYANNLSSVFFGFIGLGTILYFIPKNSGKALFSRSYILLAFWLIALAAPFGGIPSGAPLPAWMPSVSAMSSALLIVPIIAIAMTIRSTLGKEQCVSGWTDDRLKFFLFATTAFVLGGMLAAVGPVLEIFNHVFPLLYNGSPVAEMPWFGGNIEGTPFSADNFTQFTLITPALAQLAVHGFLAMALFGAIYQIAPRLVGGEIPSPTWKEWHWRLAAAGVALTVLPLIVGGIYQGTQWNENLRVYDLAQTFPVRMLQVSFLGQLLLLGGASLFLLNLKLMWWRSCCPCCVPSFLRAGEAKPETMEASS